MREREKVKRSWPRTSAKRLRVPNVALTSDVPIWLILGRHHHHMAEIGILDVSPFLHSRGRKAGSRKWNEHVMCCSATKANCSLIKTLRRAVSRSTVIDGDLNKRAELTWTTLERTFAVISFNYTYNSLPFETHVRLTSFLGSRNICIYCMYIQYNNERWLQIEWPRHFVYAASSWFHQRRYALIIRTRFKKQVLSTKNKEKISQTLRPSGAIYLHYIKETERGYVLSY